MNNLEQLVQYVEAYNRICGICNLLTQEIKMLNGVIGSAARCYQYDDTNVCGVYVTNVQNRLINKYNSIVNTILPQIKSMINKKQEEIEVSQMTN